MRLGSKVTVNPLRSLPARITLLVFGATFVTSLIVTIVSVQAIDSFLRGKIELKFPEVAQETDAALRTWYDQQSRSLGVLAESDVLANNVGLVDPAEDEANAGTLGDIDGYLKYVRDRFEHFQALFVLHPDGSQLAWVGKDFVLPRDVLSELVVADGGSKPLFTEIDGEYLQVVSHPIVSPSGSVVGQLGTVMPLSALNGPLGNPRLGETGEVYLTDPEGLFVAVGRSGVHVGLLPNALPVADRPGEVLEYTDRDGNRVVGFALPLPQYGLTLAIQERYSETFAPLLAAFRDILTINLCVVLLFGLAAWRIARSIAKPIEALSEAARRISDDEANVEIPMTTANDEVGVLTRSFSEMTSRLANKAKALENSRAETERVVQQMREQNAELQRASEIFEQLSITDGLTKLHNHRFFQEQLVKEARRADRTHDPLALVLIDIDHFKKWNDHVGHAGGDEILRSIAQIMNELVRETDILARYGGEEFCLILPKTEIDGAIMLAEKIRGRVSERSRDKQAPAGLDRLSVSVGVNVYRGDVKQLFAGADQALYQAKNGGRDCVVAYEPS